MRFALLCYRRNLCLLPCPAAVGIRALLHPGCRRAWALGYGRRWFPGRLKAVEGHFHSQSPSCSIREGSPNYKGASDGNADLIERSIIDTDHERGTTQVPCCNANINTVVLQVLVALTLGDAGARLIDHP